jgi:succinoglycan biosynthesis protein ExoM
MPGALHHICVCVCTYKRPEYLSHLLRELGKQETRGLFTFAAVVCDNDSAKSAEAVVAALVPQLNFPVRYCVETRQNIALARNKAIENADGDFIAFIDDDEFPTERWLLSLYQAVAEYHSDGALGPVKPHFDTKPPAWVVNGKFYDRPSYPTGFVIDWKKGRTGNVLLKKEVFAEGELFRPEFRTGEDQDFFRRQIEKGRKFVWCHEAVAYEFVPPVRWNMTFMLKRALLRGATTLVHPTFGQKEIVKSIVAIPAYTIALPFALFLGQGRFMNLLVSLFDHIGRVLALVGINAVKDPYVTE